MPRQAWSGTESRKIVSRLIVEGDLVLQTPAHLGNGEGDDLTDMLLLVDPFDGKAPVLTGASIAGALRSYLREREEGYGPKPKGSKAASVLLFGGMKGDDTGEQSPLIVDDAFGKCFGTEQRDGVQIRPDSLTAANDALFNIQLWQAGSVFPLRFELVIREKDNADTLKQALASALNGLAAGDITLGARKRRGYGQIQVSKWRVKTYDLKQAQGLLDWIQHGGQFLSGQSIQSIQNALGVQSLIVDRRNVFSLKASFSLDSSLLIRSGGGKDDHGPDMVHLRAKQVNGQMEAVLSGTSLAGALRARAFRIANTLGPSKAHALIEDLFGKTSKASRVGFKESIVENAKTDLVQNRVSIDRFTGGARDTALFNEQPAFGNDDTTVTVELQLTEPQPHEIGLLLLVLKDLWTGDLALGGERSVGRGRLKGKKADLLYRHGTQHEWKIHAEGDKDNAVTVSGCRAVLEDYVAALNTYMKASAP